MELAEKNIEITRMNDNEIDKIRKLESVLLQFPQVKLETTHVLHAGIYARTIKIPKGTLFTGALIKIPTVLIIQGHCKVYMGESSKDYIGYNVIPASANRKGGAYAYEDTWATVLCATNASSVEEAEKELTDEFLSLMSNNNLAENHYITIGEHK
jgi:hypothetical protein